MTPKTTMEGYDYHDGGGDRGCVDGGDGDCNDAGNANADDVSMVSFQETEDNYEEINLKRGDGLKREDISEV